VGWKISARAVLTMIQTREEGLFATDSAKSKHCDPKNNRIQKSFWKKICRIVIIVCNHRFPNVFLDSTVGRKEGKSA
jgi:hypothetical protein